MPKLFLTGDRSMPVPGAALIVSITLLRELKGEIELVTGDNTGVEAAVRIVAEAASVPCQVIETPLDPDGRPDWDGRTADVMNLEDGDVRVVVIHGDPLASNMCREFLTSDGTEGVELVSPVLVFA